RRRCHDVLRAIYYAPPRVGVALEVIDHLWLIAAWFRKHPQERQRCLAVENVLPRQQRRCSSQLPYTDFDE
ncbi:MAG TPA: hypothetical protein PKD72_12755, partial [Gemmatales bacterium]|nr:hypothetical protein [Gemmatales bacterium]